MQTGEGAGGGWGVEIYMMSLVSVGLSYILYKYRSYYERGRVYYKERRTSNLQAPFMSRLNKWNRWLPICVNNWVVETFVTAFTVDYIY